MNKIILFKSLDSFVGPLLTRIFPAPSQQSINPVNNILILRPGGIGDAVLLAPALQCLKNQYPRASITILAEQRNAGVFLLTPAVDKVLRYDRPTELIPALRSKPDLMIDTEQWHHLSALTGRLTGASVSIGYGTNDRGKLFHHAISYSHDDYELNSFFRLFTPLGIELPSLHKKAFLTPPQAAKSKAEQLLNSMGNKPFVTIFPGASIAERSWGGDRFKELASRLSIEGLGIVVVGGKEDVHEGETIVNQINGLNLAGKTSLAETAAVIERSSLLISGDSGVLHIAVGLDKPTVSLFGPGIAKKWAPRGEKHIVLNKNLPCSPCTKFGYTPKCPQNAECMKSITVDEVVDAVKKLLGKI
jgi:lipopolysaccharide heptosyltransferase II